MRQMLETEGLIPVKMTDNKYCLHPEYLIELINFIGVKASAKEKETRDRMRDLRRSLYTQKNWDLYDLQVEEEFEFSSKMNDLVTREVLIELKLTTLDLDKAEKLLI